ncbi:MAG: hypothetical protein E7058_09350 [Lentisphaerae bacterium]|nr:hypothetical protein [Lentisphaerota bacterium]
MIFRKKMSFAAVTAKILLTTLSLAFFFSSADAQENLIVNGRFQTGNHAFPPYWLFLNQTGGKVEYFKDGGPENLPFIRLSDPGHPQYQNSPTPTETKRGAAHIVQTNLKLRRGGTYILSAYFRTKDLKAKLSGIRVGTGTFPVLELKRGKKGENAIVGLPKNMPEWTKIEKVISLTTEEKPNYPYYNVVVLVEVEGGQLDVSDISLIPIEEKTRRESLSAIDHVRPGLIPLTHLQFIPAKKPELEFFWVGKFSDDPQNVICEIENQKTNKKITVPFSKERFRVSLNKFVKKGMHAIDVRLIRKSDNTLLFQDSFRIRVVDIPEPAANAVRKNNMVSELFSGNVKNDFQFTAVNHRPGWVFFQFIPEDPKGTFQILLDGKELFNNKTLYQETFSELEPGKYKLQVKGCSGKLIVRLVPDMMTYALSSPRGTGNGRYNWDFAKKYWIKAMTSLNVGSMTPEERAELKNMGRRYLAPFSVKKRTEDITDGDVMLARFKTTLDLHKSDGSGVSMDEVEGWYPPVLDTYAYTMRRLSNRKNQTIMTYMTGPLTPSFAAVYSAAINAQGTKNWVAFELYNRSLDSEERHRNRLEENSRFWSLLHSSFGELAYYAGPAFGNFSEHPSISLDHYPQVNFKYFLDMSLYMTANDPNFDGLRKIGFWGTYAADEEIVRWSFALLRHYAVEGNTEMLSKKLGYSYISGHLQNGSFEEGLKYWKTSGNAVLESYPNFGTGTLVLHSPAWDNTGDRLVLFHKTSDQVSSISQPVKNLVKGKTYCLKFFTADYLKVVKKQPSVEVLPIDFKLTNAKIIRTVQHKGQNPSGGLKDAARPNVTKVFFQAESDQAELTISNAQAPAGSMLTVNQISVHPYFAPEESK